MTMVLHVPARLVVLASGSGTTLQALIDAPDPSWVIVGVGADRPGTGALERAARAGIFTFVTDFAATPDRGAWNDALAAAIAELQPDLVVLAGFMRILGPDVVARFPFVNTHPSLLPSFPGVGVRAVRAALAALPGEQADGARLVFTGGTAELAQPEGLDEARGVRALWLALGVPETRMSFETRSRNTYENATLTRALVQPKPGETWLLVTSAAHMPRSVGIFRAAGWPVTAYPVDYRTSGTPYDFRPTTQAIDQQRKLEVAAHEWIGLLAYRLTGRTATLFPAP